MSQLVGMGETGTVTTDTKPRREARQTQEAPMFHLSHTGAFLTRSALAIAAITFASGCATSMAPNSATQPAGVAAAPQPPQLFKGLGSHTRTVSTKNAEAQRYF